MWFPCNLEWNFQVTPGAKWLALRCKHIPDRYEHRVRTIGWYSIPGTLRVGTGSIAARRCRAHLRQASSTEFAARAKATWVRLIRKVNAADPLDYPQRRERDSVFPPGPKCKKRAEARHRA